MQVFQLTTAFPQFPGQHALPGQDGKTYYRCNYETFADAKAAAIGHIKAQIWAFTPGLNFGGEMLLRRGYV